MLIPLAVRIIKMVSSIVRLIDETIFRILQARIYLAVGRAGRSIRGPLSDWIPLAFNDSTNAFS